MIVRLVCVKVAHVRLETPVDGEVIHGCVPQVAFAYEMTSVPRPVELHRYERERQREIVRADICLAGTERDREPARQDGPPGRAADSERVVPTEPNPSVRQLADVGGGVRIRVVDLSIVPSDIVHEDGHDVWLRGCRCHMGKGPGDGDE